MIGLNPRIQFPLTGDAIEAPATGHLTYIQLQHIMQKAAGWAFAVKVEREKITSTVSVL